MARRLSIRELNFCEKVVEGIPISQAYVQAGYSAHHCNQYRLMTRPRVTGKINALRASMAQRHVVTTDSIIAELEHARAKADELQQPSAMVQAIVSKAKIAGIWTDKAEVTNRDEFSGKSVEELKELLRAELEQAVSDINQKDRDTDAIDRDDIQITNETPKSIN